MSELVMYPAAGLREVCEPVEDFDSTLTDVYNELVRIGEEVDALAVAGPQIGVQRRVFARRLAGSCWELIVNPTFAAVSDDLWTYKEGCLSIPGSWYVNRPRTVTMNYYGPDGTKGTSTESDLSGRVLQHEMDHLNGVLLVDHISKHDRKELHRALAIQ